MITLDTNVWVRYVTNDDHLQARRAMKLLEQAEAVFVPKTVLLELEWVLRAAYELKPEVIRQALLQIAGLPMVTVEASVQVAAAIDGYAAGLDFADALHLASAEGSSCLYTFDEKFIRRSKQNAPAVKMVPVRS